MRPILRNRRPADARHHHHRKKPPHWSKLAGRAPAPSRVYISTQPLGVFMSSNTALRSLRRTAFRALSTILTLLPWGEVSLHAQQIYQPAADAKAIVVEGQGRFTVLTPRLIRM